jgi:uncharacterized repeat protein (TIGR03803 family)
MCDLCRKPDPAAPGAFASVHGRTEYPDARKRLCAEGFLFRSVLGGFMLKFCVAVLGLVCILSAAEAAGAPPGGGYKVIYRFQGGDEGFNPNSSLAGINGTLYGMTAQGGPGIGLAFALNAKTGAYKVIHAFTGGNDGLTPNAGGLIVAGHDLYGTTSQGGSREDQGVAFSMNPKSGADKILHAFTGGSDGSQPNANLLDIGGVFYGTTLYGGEPNSLGTVFSIDKKTGSEQVLYAFQGGNDGLGPYAALVEVGGTLYGTTIYGGPGSCNDGNEPGCGTFFSIDPKTGAEKVIYSFKGGSDGSYPTDLTVLNGEIYGTTSAGGSFNTSCNSVGCGTVFAIDPATGAKQTVYAFQGGTDGWLPYAGVIAVGGTLYGTTGAGGSANCTQGCGTVFSVDPATGAETILHEFQSGSDGELPVGGLIAMGDKLYGTTNYGGGIDNYGTVFALKP